MRFVWVEVGNCWKMYGFASFIPGKIWFFGFSRQLKRSYDEKEINAAIEKGTVAWADVPSAVEFVRDVRK